jgi:hypothetical protein
MESFTYNREWHKAEYWLYECPSAEEFILWVTRKAIAGYKNYVTHGKDEADTTLYEIELIINENLKPVEIFNINNLNSNAELEFLENVTIFVRSVSTDSHMCDFPSKQTIRLKFWFILDDYSENE